MLILQIEVGYLWLSCERYAVCVITMLKEYIKPIFNSHGLMWWYPHEFKPPDNAGKRTDILKLLEGEDLITKRPNKGTVQYKLTRKAVRLLR